MIPRGLAHFENRQENDHQTENDTWRLWHHGVAIGNQSPKANRPPLGYNAGYETGFVNSLYHLNQNPK
jgi:hypothetical protein